MISAGNEDLVSSLGVQVGGYHSPVRYDRSLLFIMMYTNLLLRFSEKRDLFSYSGSCGEDLDKNKETVMSVSTLEGG